MIALPAGTRVWLVAGVTDMRCGFQGLAAKVQTALEENPLGGNVFIFRGRRGDLVKLLWATDDGLWLLAKRLERGRFIWPQADGGKIHLTSGPSAPRHANRPAMPGAASPGRRARRLLPPQACALSLPG